MKKTMLVLVLPLLAACDQYYRYPCQNPSNWDKPFCQKPICEVNRDCPEFIFKSQNPAKPASVNTKGDCK